MNNKNPVKSKLTLEDSTVFGGQSFSSPQPVSGEVVFNTGMVGYPEALTDPSYRGQILVFTYPLIGNYGVPERKGSFSQYFESHEIQVKGVICSDYSFKHNHWNATKSLSQWLEEENVPGLFNVDTRKLTKILREQGTMLGKIEFDNFEQQDFFDPNDKHIVSEVSCKKPITYNKNEDKKLKIVGLDCGIKHSIIRSFVNRDVEFIRVPYNYPLDGMDFDGLLISNGPGNPEVNKEVIKLVKQTLERDVPILGICLGAQIMALAAGGETYKLKYGHRSQNQPVIDLKSNQCFITSQNHGFAIKSNSLSQAWEIWFENVNDETVEGIKHKTKPFYGIQFHPEASPGPTETRFLFDSFLSEVREYAE